MDYRRTFCKYCLPGALMAALSVASLNAAAATLFQAELAEKKLEHQFEFEAGGESRLKGDMMAAVLGLTYAFDKAYVNFTGEFPVREYTGYQHTPEASLVTLTRTDYALTFGYNLGKGWSVFGGYKYGETSADTASIDFNPPGEFLLNTFDIVEEGPYIGASGNFSLDAKDVLNISVAYASMKSDFINRASDAGGGGTGAPSSDGDAAGFSLALKWAHELTSDTLFNVGLKLNRYTNDNTDYNGEKMDGESEYRYITIGLAHFFN